MDSFMTCAGIKRTLRKGIMIKDLYLLPLMGLLGLAAVVMLGIAALME